MYGRVVAVNVSERKGVRKHGVPSITLRPDHGIEGDAHAGPWHRQVSLLAIESIRKMQEKGLQVGPGDFAENITTEGLDLLSLSLGTRLQIGEALVEVSQIGKICHTRCAIYYQAGDCVMPREGIFVKVLKGGTVKPGDRIEVLPSGATPAKSGENVNREGLLTPIRVGILTTSDKGSRGERKDESGEAIKEIMTAAGAQVVEYNVVPDQRQVIAEVLKAWCDSGKVDLILTTGGTGFSPRDVTPEATLDVIEREAPGIPEAVRAAGLRHTPRAMLSRARAGIRGRTLIINLPGSVRGVQESLEVILPVLAHGIAILRGEASECARTGGDNHHQGQG